MWENDPTAEQIDILIGRGIKVLPPIEKTLACGDTGIGAMCNHQSIIDALPSWQPPIKSEIFIPTGEHPGAFAVKRKYDIHTGVDIYCEGGEPVYAMEDGDIYHGGWFTGTSARPPSDWWNDTRYLVIRGKSGFILYGEIWESKELLSGGINRVKVGDLLGTVRAVLPLEKKRLDIPHHSNAMLHIELHRKSWNQGFIWRLNEKRHKQLMNPTPFLKSIKGAIT